MAKLIYAESLAAFKIAFPNFAVSTDPSYRTICHTGDGYIITHGKVMKANVTGDTENPYGLEYTLSGQTATVTIAGVSKSITLPVIGMGTDTTDILSVSGSNGNYKINHALGNAGWTGNQTVGPLQDNSDSITIPNMVFDKYGHYKSVTNRTATLNKVKQNLNNDANTKYLLFGTSATTTTNEAQFSTAIKAVASTGTLYATVFNQNGKALSEIYAPINHASTAATYGLGNSSNYGHVKLSDSTASSSDVTGGIAATPKAVSSALTSAKTYADGLFASNDAMVFVGTLDGSTGIIVTVNSIYASKYSITAGVSKISDLTNYSAGWTFRVSKAGSISGVGTLEIGDMVTCVSDYATAYKATDWTVIQTNIDGAVISSNDLTANTVILGSGGHSIKSLTNGSNGQALKIVNGVPTWTTDNTTRQIKVNSSNFLASNTDTPFDVCAGTNVSFGVDSATGKLTINSNALTTGDIYGLTFQNNGTGVLTYTPSTAAMNVNIKSGLKASNVSGALTIEHSNSTTAQATTAVRSFTYDSHGHITGSSVVTALKNPNAFTYGVGSTTDSYDGETAKSLKFAGSGATSVSFSSGTITISSQDTHHTAYLRAGVLNGTANAASTNGNTYLNLVENGSLRSGVNIIGTGATTVVSDASGKVTISSTNSWRDVLVCRPGTSAAATSISQASLKFGSSFGWSENEVELMWAEVDSSGAITYAV